MARMIDDPADRQDDGDGQTTDVVPDEQEAIKDYRRFSINAAVVDHHTSLFTDLTSRAMQHAWSMEEVRDQLSRAAGDDLADAWVDWCEEADRG